MAASHNFVYDSTGNLIEDKYLQGESSKNALVHFYCRTVVYCALRNSRRLKISYDWREMPVEFVHDVSDANDAYKLVMAYDGSGRRISKTRMRKNDQHGYWYTDHVTHYTGKVTENFTGKEKDDETELNYFGARYLDPMLGVWTSVDPARQFSSPYLYAGNGMNPINVVDPDGNSDIVVLRPGTNDISNVIHIDDSFNLVGLVSDESTEYYDAPPKDSYFYTEILIGQKFDPDMDQKARILIKDAYEQGPLAFYKWGEKGSLDFKNSAYSGADKTIGVLNRTIMTARDAGNAIWAGWTRYSYLNVINPIPERYSVKLNYVGMVILRDGYAIIQNALKREFKTEDPASAVMQKWGYYNYQP